MFGCWRKVDASDPETFITAVAAVLAGYPEWIVYVVTDPRTGLPGKQAFPPSAFEVRQACEAEMAPTYRQRERERRLAQPLMLEAPREQRPTLSELRAKYGDNWGLAGDRVKRGATATGADVKREANRRLEELACEAREVSGYSVSNELAKKLDEWRREPRPMAAE